MKKQAVICVFTVILAILICVSVNAVCATTKIDSGSKTFYGSKGHSYVTFHWDTYKVNSNYVKMQGYYYNHNLGLKIPMTIYFQKASSKTLKVGGTVMGKSIGTKYYHTTSNAVVMYWNLRSNMIKKLTSGF